jgi:hypothetical protein
MTPATKQQDLSARTASIGNWGLTFLADGLVAGTVYFPVGPQGPIEGSLGSPERERYRQAARDWVDKGILWIGPTAR